MTEIKKVIIITGSRTWSNREAIADAIRGATESNAPRAEYIDPKTIAIFHGACPTGADFHAHNIAQAWGLTEYQYPADWAMGKEAGPERNREMCKAAKQASLFYGCDVECLAFWDGVSRGTLSCISEAVRFGIRVSIIPDSK